MNAQQEEKINELLVKYNDILMISMRLAIAEDFTNLVIANRDDPGFELSNLLQYKEDFSNYVMREFLKINSSSVLTELKTMDESFMDIKKNFALKRKKK
jgi:hypothetical protein